MSARLFEAVVAFVLIGGLLLLDVPLFFAALLGTLGGIVVRGIRNGWKQ